MRPLGKVQQSVLEGIKRHGFWSMTRCGWVWDSQLGTKRVVESLVRRGLVVVETEPDGRVVYRVKNERSK